MFKRKLRLIPILFAFVILLSVPGITIGATNDVDVWSPKQISDARKVWTVAFSQPLKESSIKNTTVYVEDEAYRLFFTDVTLSSDKKSIIVTPRNAYQENKTYRLNITKDVTSEKGKKLAKSIVLPFALNEVSGTNNPTTSDKGITNVNLSTTNFATRVTAISNDSVNRVTANSKDMHYEGNNTYSIGLTGLSTGSKVLIQAYDISGKRIFSGTYTVN